MLHFLMSGIDNISTTNLVIFHITLQKVLSVKKLV